MTKVITVIRNCMNVICDNVLIGCLFILFKLTATTNFPLTGSIIGETLLSCYFHHLKNIQLKCQSSGILHVTVQFI